MHRENVLGSIDISCFKAENLAPVPLKHHSETAYMISLALVTCATGFLIALLPHIPAGMPYFAALFVATLLYPLMLARTFKRNRADYEFRMLHWFPFFMVMLWAFFELIGSKARIFHILQLGFFFLWSLPLVALGICFLILFAVHVIRRRSMRITVLSLFLAFFTVGAVASEAMGWDDDLQKAIYPKDLPTSESVKKLYASARSYLGILTGTSGSSSSSSSNTTSVLSSSSALSTTSSSLSSVRSTYASSVLSTPALVTSSKPTSLPASGPESAAVLAATLIALYMGTLHIRARRRV